MADSPIFCEVTMRGIQDGKVFSETKQTSPELSKASYHAIEHALTATLLGLGDANGKAKK